MAVCLLVIPAALLETARGAEVVENQSQRESAFSLSCVWQDDLGIGLGESGVVPVVSADETPFECEITNKEKEQGASLLLSGKQIDSNGAADATAIAIDLGTGGSQKATLTFPRVYRSGQYQYVFSLFDTVTKQSVAKDFVLTGELEGDAAMQVSIDQVSLDKEQYEWTDSFVLNVTLNNLEKQDLSSEPLSLHVALQDKTGAPCAVLSDSQRIMNSEEKLKLKFPGEGTCVNGMVVALRDAKGMVLDQKILAVGLPETKPVHEGSALQKTGMLNGVPLLVQVGLIMTFCLLLILGGYFFLRKQKRRF